MNRLASGVAAFVSVSAAAVLGAAAGLRRPSTALWYALLRKPAFTPPAPAVGAAWSVLEVVLGVIGYRLLRAPKAPSRALALGAWGATLAGLAGYPWLFFTQRRLGASVAASGAMLASALTMAAAARKVDRPASILAAPLIAWLAFANGLGEELWRANRGRSAD